MTKAAQFRTVGQVVGWWADRLERNSGVSASYRDTMVSLARRHVIPRLGKVALKRLERATVDNDLVWPMQDDLSAHTVHKAVQVLTTALRVAAEQRRIEHNPLAGVSFRTFWTGKLKPKPGALLPLDVATVMPKLAEAFERRPIAGMLALAVLGNGTRIGETFRAERKHICLIERVWFFPAGNTKTSEMLKVPLTAQMVALLTRYWQSLPAGRQGSRWVFPGPYGRPLSEKQAQELIKAVSGGEWTSHDLRKVARTVWAELGIDFFTAESMLNHSLGGVVKTYVQTTADQQRREAMERWHGWLDARGFTAAHGLKSSENGIS